MNVEVAWNDQNPTIMSRVDDNNDEKRNDDSEDRFLEEMLAKAARLANEMKEISSKQSGCITTSSKSSKDGRRSLPKEIDVQPQDDAARSECSSLGYSLATATPSVLVPTPTIKLLSTTIENFAEGYFLSTSNHQHVEQQQQSSATTCSVINEGSVNVDDEKKSCNDDSTQEQKAGALIGIKPMFHMHSNICSSSETVYHNSSNDIENIRNMSSRDMLLLQQQSLLLRTPPKVKRTSHQEKQRDPSGTLPLSSSFASTNPALLSTIATTKSLSKELVDKNAISSKLLERPHASQQQQPQRPTTAAIKISQKDDDYVPIADYSIRNTSSTGVVQWEKIVAPTVNDDDYVSLKDYSNFPKFKKKTKENVPTTGLSFAQQRSLLLKRRRQRKRSTRRLVVISFIVLTVLCHYYWHFFRNSIITAGTLVISVLNYFEQQWFQVVNHDVVTPTVKIEELVKEDDPATSTVMLSTADFIMPDLDNIVVQRHVYEKSSGSIVSNGTIEVEYDHHDEGASQPPKTPTGNELISTGTTSMSAKMKHKTSVKPFIDTIPRFDAIKRQRFIEELIHSMMQ